MAKSMGLQHGDRFGRLTVIRKDGVHKKPCGTVKRYVEKLQEHIARGEGLILAGKYGTMKTTMAVAILKHQLIERDGGGYFVPMATLIDNLFSMRARDREEAGRYEHRLRTTPLLVIDDLGAENTTQDFILAKTDSIITVCFSFIGNLRQVRISGDVQGVSMVFTELFLRLFFLGLRELLYMTLIHLVIGTDYCRKSSSAPLSSRIFKPLK